VHVRRPSEIVLVGDDVENDYEGARAAGLRAILFDPDGKYVAVRERVVRLSDLVAKDS
jgi:putative hydrolase of the HAD superfamily